MLGARPTGLGLSVQCSYLHWDSWTRQDQILGVLVLLLVFKYWYFAYAIALSPFLLLPHLQPSSLFLIQKTLIIFCQCLLLNSQDSTEGWSERYYKLFSVPSFISVLAIQHPSWSLLVSWSADDTLPLLTTSGQVFSYIYYMIILKGIWKGH